MSKWDERFLGLAEHVAQWSRDPSTKVGAVIADPDKRVVSLGFNGFPRGIRDDERLHDRATKLRMIVHAERNAMLFARGPLGGCVLYTWPLPPCSECAAMVIQVGIVRVVAPPPSQGHLERMGESLALARALFAEARVAVDIVPAAAR